MCARVYAIQRLGHAMLRDVLVWSDPGPGFIFSGPGSPPMIFLVPSGRV